MDEFVGYIYELMKTMEAGTIDNFPAPDDPDDLGDPLTQDDIDFVKRLRKEISERFNSEPEP